MFTKGEWKVEEADMYGHFITTNQRESALAKVFNPDSQANANLIAAAPDMYEALEGLEPTLQSMAETVLHPTMRTIVTNAFKALSKAEGGK